MDGLPCVHTSARHTSSIMALVAPIIRQGRAPRHTNETRNTLIAFYRAPIISSGPQDLALGTKKKYALLIRMMTEPEFDK